MTKQVKQGDLGGHRKVKSQKTGNPASNKKGSRGVEQLAKKDSEAMRTGKAAA